MAIYGEEDVCAEVCTLGLLSRRQGLTVSSPRGRSGRACRTQCLPEQVALARIARGQSVCGSECPDSPDACPEDPECGAGQVRFHRIQGMRGNCREQCGPPAALNGNAICGPCPE